MGNAPVKSTSSLNSKHRRRFTYKYTQMNGTSKGIWIFARLFSDKEGYVREANENKLML